MSGSRRRCTCCCLISKDDFDRVDSSDLGSDWTEESGDWSIASQELAIGDANSLLVNTNESSGATAYVYVAGQLDTNGGPSGQHRMRVVVDYVDSSNYHFAEIDVDWFGGGIAAINIGVRTSGSDTILTSDTYADWLTVSTPFQVKVCLLDGYLVANVINASDSEMATTSSTITNKNGTMAGLAIVDAEDWTFTRFEWQKHDSESGGCPDCTGRCGSCNEAQDLPYTGSVILSIPAGTFTTGSVECGAPLSGFNAVCTQLHGDFVLDNRPDASIAVPGFNTADSEDNPCLYQFRSALGTGACDAWSPGNDRDYFWVAYGFFDAGAFGFNTSGTDIRAAVYAGAATLNELVGPNYFDKAGLVDCRSQQTLTWVTGGANYCESSAGKTVTVEPA